MLNRIVLVGRLVRDPELRYTGSGTAVCNFTLAVERNFTNKQTGERDVDFIKVTTWRKMAENCNKYLAKGRLCAVEGNLHINKNKKNNRTYIDPFVNAENVKFLDFGDDNKTQQKQNRQQSKKPKRNQKHNEPPVSEEEPPENFDEDYDDDEFDVPF